MFIEKNAIASLIATKVDHPVRAPTPLPLHPHLLSFFLQEHLLVSTNTINSPRLAWLHSHLGAIHPFLPELSSPPPPSQPLATPASPSSPNTNNNKLNWRPSTLPVWSGNPLTYTLPRHPSPPRAPNNRWLPLPAPYNASLAGTPISLVDYEGGSKEGVTNWAVAAQEHYSFLRNLEDEKLSLYGGDGFGKGNGRGRDGKGRGERLWDMQGTRIQVNMIAIWGDDVLDNGPVAADDEHYFTVELVARLGRREFFIPPFPFSILALLSFLVTMH